MKHNLFLKHTCGIDGDPGAVAPLNGICLACQASPKPHKNPPPNHSPQPLIDLLNLYNTYSGFIKYGGRCQMNIGEFGGCRAVSIVTHWQIKKTATSYSHAIPIRLLETHADPGYLMFQWASEANAAFDRKYPTAKEVVPPGYSDTLE